ncbi:polysaccharide pyruvyl transferase family protein [Xanthobacter sp. TB0139]|uniref:polysaccharide pyruvyl transferase family protein n=1 Tax=Xanthobacter sp. TB0139 TaxID=3459178 RepID=UPI00403944A3
MRSAAYFVDATDPVYSESINFSIIGGNTGNCAFISGIAAIIDLDVLPRGYIHASNGELADYSTFVTSDLIWIRQGVEAPDTIKTLLDRHSDKKIVAISVGLHSKEYRSDFALSPDMKYTLERIADRSTIAVRGNYTAEILSKYGIRNIEVIGCPSVYQYPLYQKSFHTILDRSMAAEESGRYTANFRTFYEALSAQEIETLRYFADNFQGFAEQTHLRFSEMKPFSEPDYDRIRAWISENEKVMFSLSEWVDYCSHYDFSMGSRFHGNVIAFLAGIRSLVIVCDTRTRELAEFFSFPFIEEDEFQANLPVSSYIDRADFTPMISDYHNKIARFHIFLQRNGLRFSDRFQAALGAFDFSRIGRPWIADVANDGANT